MSRAFQVGNIGIFNLRPSSRRSSTALDNRTPPPINKTGRFACLRSSINLST